MATGGFVIHHVHSMLGYINYSVNNENMHVFNCFSIGMLVEITLCLAFGGLLVFNAIYKM